MGTTGYFTENSPYDPHSPYAASKAASDHLAKAWQHTFGLPVILTHCSNNYGPYQFPEKLIPVVILTCLRREPIPVYGRGENIRDWLYVQDHCEALWTVLSRGRVGQTYNIGGDNEWRNIDLVRQICQFVDELNLTMLDDRARTPSRSDASFPHNSPPQDVLSIPVAPPPSLGEVDHEFLHDSPRGEASGVACSTASSTSLITFVPDRPGHDWRYAMDTSKIKNELGWAPKQEPLTGLKQTVLWYKDNQDWCTSASHHCCSS